MKLKTSRKLFLWWPRRAIPISNLNLFNLKISNLNFSNEDIFNLTIGKPSNQNISVLKVLGELDAYAFGGLLAVLSEDQVLSPYQITHKVTKVEEQPPLAHLPSCIQVISMECLSKCSGCRSIGHPLLISMPKSCHAAAL